VVRFHELIYPQRLDVVQQNVPTPSLVKGTAIAVQPDTGVEVGAGVVTTAVAVLVGVATTVVAVLVAVLTTVVAVLVAVLTTVVAVLVAVLATVVTVPVTVIVPPTAEGVPMFA